MPLKLNFKIDVKGLKKLPVKLFDFLLRKAFLFFLILFTLEFVCGVLIFYYYTFPKSGATTGVGEKSFTLNRELLDDVLLEFSKNNLQFNEPVGRKEFITKVFN